jgi:hypothetical protein
VFALHDQAPLPMSDSAPAKAAANSGSAESDTKNQKRSKPLLRFVFVTTTGVVGWFCEDCDMRRDETVDRICVHAHTWTCGASYLLGTNRCTTCMATTCVSVTTIASTDETYLHGMFHIMLDKLMKFHTKCCGKERTINSMNLIKETQTTLGWLLTKSRDKWAVKGDGQSFQFE